MPVLSPGMNLFRHLSDSLDNELLSQVITSSLTMFIELDEGNNILPDYVHARRKSASEPPRYYQSVESGTIMYGNPNERPHMLETSSPSPNFEQFCRFVLRSMAASVDMPYEVIAKDFSQTNYSTARAAMLEAWKVFTHLPPVARIALLPAHFPDGHRGSVAARQAAIPGQGPGLLRRPAASIPPRCGSAPPAAMSTPSKRSTPCARKSTTASRPAGKPSPNAGAIWTAS